MTKESVKSFMDNPALKFAGYVAGLCSLYFGLRSEIRENKATQVGRDNVQDVLIRINTEDMITLKEQFNLFVNREGIKPKSTHTPSNTESE